MNEFDLFMSLEKKEKSDVLSILRKSYSEMNTQQREIVFGEYINNEIKKLIIEKHDAEEICDEVNDFYVDSLAGVYYAPFKINSKNYMNLPEETDDWCSKFCMLLDETSQLAKHNFHKEAVQCFQKLFNLIDKIGDDNIIFGDEIGSWMVGGNRKQATIAYISSASHILTDNEFVDHLIPILVMDSHESFSNEVYRQASLLSTNEKFSLLQLTIEQKKIKIPIGL